MAARRIEDDRCAEWDRVFAAMQEKDQAQSLHLHPAAAVSRLQSITSSHSSSSSLQGYVSSQPHKRNFRKSLTWLRRGKVSRSS